MGQQSKRCYVLPFLILVWVIALFARDADATILRPGATVAPSFTDSPLAATLIADTGNLPFTSIDGTSFSGTLRSRAYTNDVFNPFGQFAVTCTYLLTNTGPAALERLVTLNFAGPAGYDHDVCFNNRPDHGGAIGMIPDSVDRSEWPGKMIGWNFDDGIGLPAGASSTLLVVHSHAAAFSQFNASVIDGSTATVSSLGPLLFPEPSNLAAFGLTFAQMSACRRGRRR